MSGPYLYLLLALLACAIIAIDQATKLSIVQSMRLNESIPIVPNLFSLTYIRNPGAAFGLLAGSSDAFRMVFFGVTSLFALALLGTILFRLPKKEDATTRTINQLPSAGHDGFPESLRGLFRQQGGNKFPNYHSRIRALTQRKLKLEHVRRRPAGPQV